MKRRIKNRKWMAFLLAAFMTLTTAPGVVMAEEMPGGSADVEVVSDTENTDRTDTVEETAGQCTVTEGCTLEEGHAGECVLASNDEEEINNASMSGYCGGDTTSGEHTYTYPTGDTTGIQKVYENISWSLSSNGDDTYKLTLSGSGIMADWVYVGGAIRTAVVSSPWSDYSDKITEIQMDSGITLGKRAFQGLSVLTCFSIPSDITVIPEYAFADCISLNNVTIPQTVVSIGTAAFRACDTMTEIDFPSSVVEWGDSIMIGCQNLKTVQLPSNMTEIPQGMFRDCAALENINFPDNLTGIGNNAFSGCNSLAFLDLSNTKLVTIGSSFSGISSLKQVCLPATVKTVGENAFTGTGLTSIMLPPKVDFIMGTAFGTADTPCSSLIAAVMKTEPFDIYEENDSGAGGEYWNRIGSGIFKNIGENSVVYFEGDKVPLAFSGAYAENRINPDHTALAVTNGGTFKEGTVFEAGKLSDNFRDGGIFGGWYDNPEFTGSPVTSAVPGATYYAKWISLADMEIKYGESAVMKTTDTSLSVENLSDWSTSDDKVVTVDQEGNIKAEGTGTAVITATGNFGGKETTFKAVITVTPRELVYSYTSGEPGSGSITYPYTEGHHALSDSLKFSWKDDADQIVTLEEGKDINYTYTVTDAGASGGGTEYTYDYLPMPAGVYKNVKFNLLNPNYTFVLQDGSSREYLELDVNVTDAGNTRAYLAGVKPTGSEFTYDGKGKLPVSGILQAYDKNSGTSDFIDIGTFTVNIEGLNDTEFDEEVSGIAAGTDIGAVEGLDLPTEPGTYVIIISACENGRYIYKSQVFSIARATVTITPDNQSVHVGDAMPEFTYTVSGLAEDHSLAVSPTLTCSAENTDTAGTYVITAENAEVPDTEHYNSEIIYGQGTLTITEQDHTHSYGTEWKYDNNNHWHECTCGAKADEAAHTYGEWAVTKQASSAETGVRERTCTVCGYRQTESIPAVGTENTGKKDVPSTGDDNEMTYPLFFLFGSFGLGVLALFYAKRKRGNL